MCELRKIELGMAASGIVTTTTTYKSSTTTESKSWLPSSSVPSGAKAKPVKKPTSLSVPAIFSQKVDSLSMHSFGHSLSNANCLFQVAPIPIDLDDLDDLIADLSPEEVEELSRVDPDVREQRVDIDLIHWI